MWRVEVDWAPAYELLVSLKAYGNRSERKSLEMGAAWAAEVTRRIGAEAAAAIRAGEKPSCVYLLELVIWLRPRQQSVEEFLGWLETFSPGALYELLMPYLPDDDMPSLRALAQALPETMRVLSLWNERYFRDLDPDVLSGLAANAAALRQRAQTTPAEELVEEATSGVHLLLDPPPDTVLLIPQYHYRPWNLFSSYRNLHVIEYPCDAVPPAPGEPSPALLRLTRALSDESRLRILRFLSREPLSFTAVVQRTGLSKSTVHYHMVALRAAGLVRVHDTGVNEGVTYSLRANAITALGARLQSFLMEE